MRVVGMPDWVADPVSDGVGILASKAVGIDQFDAAEAKGFFDLGESAVDVAYSFAGKVKNAVERYSASRLVGNSGSQVGT